MPTIKLLYVAGGILFSSLAQFCMKQATAFEGKQLLWALCLLSSMSCYLLPFVAYYQAIKHFPISMVSPAMTSS